MQISWLVKVATKNEYLKRRIESRNEYEWHLMTWNLNTFRISRKDTPQT